MTDIHAAIGLAQLSRIESVISRRKEIAKIYDESLKDLPVKSLNNVEKDSQHGLCFYAILLDLEKLSVDRNKIQEAILAENVGTAIHFFPMHLQPYYSKKYGHKKGDLPNAEDFYMRTISLPLASDLTNDDVDEVVLATKKVLSFFQK